MAKTRTIEIGAETADLLEARAAARKMTVSELVSDLAANDAALPEHLASLRAEGQGPWSPQALEEDARRLAEFERTREGAPWPEIKAWLESWETPAELPPPIARKL